MSPNENLLAAAAACALLCTAEAAQAQTPASGLEPFIGQWRLNTAKTHMGMSGPSVVIPVRAPTFTWIFTPTPAGVRQDVYDAYPAAAPSRTLLIHTDGKPYPCLTVQSCLPSGGDPKDQTIAYFRIDSHMLARISYVKGQMLEYDSYSVSADGKTFVVVAWRKETPEYQNVQVFDRQP